MIQFARRHLATDLCPLLLALLILALPALAARLNGNPLASRLDSGPVRSVEYERPSAQPKRGLFPTAHFESGLVRWPEDERTIEQSKRERNAALTEDLFRNNCARCHGIAGRGDTTFAETHTIPDLTDADWWRKNSKLTNSNSLILIITHGKGEMPGFGKKLTHSQIKLLVTHVRKFKQKKTSP